MMSHITMNADYTDRMKRSMFYGNEFISSYGKTGISSPVPEDLPRSHKDLTHGMIGLITESAELAENLIATLNGDQLDKVNIKEELGDILWYVSLAASACGFTLDEVKEANIEKLRKRFPNKFTNEDALNRDVAHELSHMGEK